MIFNVLLLLLVPHIGYTQEQKNLLSPDLTLLAKEFVSLLVKGNYLTAVEKCDSTVQDQMPPDKLQQIWQSLQAQVGQFRSQAGTRKEKYGNYDIVFVTCEFEKSTLDVKLVFNEARQIAGIFFLPSQPMAEYNPPSYVKADSFREKKVVVGNDKWPLPATLTLPVGKGPFSVVVLVHGSGPHDRDETIGPNKPFRDLAWGLASHNIAVLRYEKRTKVYTEKLRSLRDSITVREETVDDALAAVKLLRTMAEIDSMKIFVLGHSLGGMLIPRIAAHDPNIAGFIVLAGASRPLEDLILEQSVYIFSLNGTPSEAEKIVLEKLKQQVARVKDPNLSGETSSGDLPLGIPAQYWLDLRGYDPAKAAKTIKQPIFILQGERDYQVGMEDYQGWKNALSSRANVKFKLYPKLNHLFVEGESKSTPAEYQHRGHIAQIVIDNIAEWIGAQ